MPEPIRGFSIRRRLAWVAVGLIVVGLYGAVVIFGALDDRREPPVTSAPGALAETVVSVSVVSVDLATQTANANVTVIPGAGLVDGAGRLVDDLSVTLHPAVQQSPLTYAPGREVGTVPVQLVANGNFGQWPFDRYQTRSLVAEVAVGKSPAGRLVPSTVVVTGAASVWQTSSASQV